MSAEDATNSVVGEPVAEVSEQGKKASKNHKGRRQMDDDFMQYLYKVRMCSRSTPHNWKLCPWAHPGETAANRRHPSCHMAELCPAVRQHQECPHGDGCLYARNTFECWLHPYKYRTTMCSSGEACNRNICFFAHNEQELRSPPDVSQQWAAVTAAQQQQGMEQAAASGVNSNLHLSAAGASVPLSVLPAVQHTDSSSALHALSPGCNSNSSPLPYVSLSSMPWASVVPMSCPPVGGGTTQAQLALAMQQQQQQQAAAAAYMAPQVAISPAVISRAMGDGCTPPMLGAGASMVQQLQEQVQQVQHKQLSPAAAGFSYNISASAAMLSQQNAGAGNMMALSSATPTPGSSATKLVPLQLSAAEVQWHQHQQQAALQQAALLLQQLQLSAGVASAPSQLSAETLNSSMLMGGSSNSSTMHQLTHLSAASDLSTDSYMMPSSCYGMNTQDMGGMGGSSSTSNSASLLNPVMVTKDMQLLPLESSGLIQLSPLDDCGTDSAAPQACQVTLPMAGQYW